MKKYLGQQLVDVKDSPYADYSKQDWVLYFIYMYGQIDGSHHKQWVLDQVVRLLHDVPVVINLASWDDGTTEYRIWLREEPTQQYLDWVKNYCNDEEDGDPNAYSYDPGIAP